MILRRHPHTPHNTTRPHARAHGACTAVAAGFTWHDLTRLSSVAVTDAMLMLACLPQAARTRLPAPCSAPRSGGKSSQILSR